MAENKLDKLIETVKTLTLMEAAEAVKRLRKELNLPEMTSMMAAAGAMTASANTAGGDVEEKTEFDVVLEACPADKKIAVLKVVREITGVGLGEAKALVESAPKELKTSVAKAEAEEIKKRIEAAGGVVKLK